MPSQKVGVPSFFLPHSILLCKCTTVLGGPAYSWTPRPVACRSGSRGWRQENDSLLLISHLPSPSSSLQIDLFDFLKFSRLHPFLSLPSTAFLAQVIIFLHNLLTGFLHPNSPQCWPHCCQWHFFPKTRSSSMASYFPWGAGQRDFLNMACNILLNVILRFQFHLVTLYPLSSNSSHSEFLSVPCSHHAFLGTNKWMLWRMFQTHSYPYFSS